MWTRTHNVQFKFEQECFISETEKQERKKNAFSKIEADILFGKTYHNSLFSVAMLDFSLDSSVSLD